jgi:hypothetical protein
MVLHVIVSANHETAAIDRTLRLQLLVSDFDVSRESLVGMKCFPTVFIGADERSDAKVENLLVLVDQRQSFEFPVAVRIIARVIWASMRQFLMRPQMVHRVVSFSTLSAQEVLSAAFSVVDFDVTLQSSSIFEDFPAIIAGFPVFVLVVDEFLVVVEIVLGKEDLAALAWPSWYIVGWMDVLQVHFEIEFGVEGRFAVLAGEVFQSELLWNVLEHVRNQTALLEVAITAEIAEKVFNLFMNFFNVF